MRVAGVGAYAPRFRLSSDAVADALGRFRARGVDSVAVPDADEDALTMAAEAGDRALDAAGVDAVAVDAVYLASTTLPYDEEAGTGRLRSLLGLGDATDSRQFGGSTDAGGEAFATALDGDELALVVASDAPRGAPDETVGHAAGAGAAAFVVAPDGPGRVAGRAAYTTAYPGTRFRERGSDETTGLGVTSYDRQAYRETVTGAIEALGDPTRAVDPADAVDAVALQAPDGDLPYRVAGGLDIDTDVVAAGTVARTLGDAGVASPLLGVADALDDGVEDVLLATYGSGGTAHAFRLVAESAVPVNATLAGDRDIDFAAAERRRGAFDSGVPEGGGAYVSVPSYRRTLPQRHRLVAGRCRACGALRFPPEGACTDCCARDGYDDAQLSTRGTVDAATTISQGGAPPEFVPQQARAGEYASAIVAFDGPDGGSVSVPVQVVLADGGSAEDEDEDKDRASERTDGTPAIGDEVVAVPRLLYEQEGVRRYGVKAVSADTRRG